MIELWCSMFGWLSCVSEFSSHFFLPLLFGFLLKYSSISARLWLLKWCTRGQRKHFTNLGHVWALCSVVRKHMKQALCFLHLSSLYSAVYLFVLQKAVSCVFCSQNMQYFGHDGPSAGEPLFPLETFDWPRPVAFHCFLLVAVNPDPSLPYLWFVALRPESLTMRYGQSSITSVCSTRALCVPKFCGADEICHQVWPVFLRTALSPQCSPD